MTSFTALRTMCQPDALKRDFLLFDRIGLLGLDRLGIDTQHQYNMATFDWLSKKGLVFDPRPTMDPLDKMREDTVTFRVVMETFHIWLFLDSMQDLGGQAYRKLTRLLGVDEAKFALIRDAYRHVSREVNLRVVVQHLRARDKCDYVPLLRISPARSFSPESKAITRRQHDICIGAMMAMWDQSRPMSKEKEKEVFRPLMDYVIDPYAEALDSCTDNSGFPKTNKEIKQKDGLRRESVLEIGVRNLPVPSDTVPWEQILDYVSDPDTKARQRNFRRWLRKMAAANVDVFEIQQEIEDLIHDFEDHMRFHKMSVDIGYVEGTLTLLAEVAEDLAKVKLRKLIKTLFTLKHRRIALLKAERNAPGYEISYVIKARERFGIANDGHP